MYSRFPSQAPHHLFHISSRRIGIRDSLMRLRRRMLSPARSQSQRPAMVAAHYHGDGRMPNLDELDPTQPDGAIIKVAQLDDFIRETRQKLKAWALGDASDGEHHANGRHFIHQGSATYRDID